MIARWLRRYRIRWLERKADELEREFAGSIAARLAQTEADQMRRKARMLK